jgi:hypothetical protein
MPRFSIRTLLLMVAAVAVGLWFYLHIGHAIWMLVIAYVGGAGSQVVYRPPAARAMSRR